MGESFSKRLQHAWNAFNARDETDYVYKDLGVQSSYNQAHYRISSRNERSIINAVYTRIAMDVAAYDICHVRTDDSGRYLETINSTLQNCFSIEANKDQTGRAFIQDVVMSMFDEGSVAIVPVDTSLSPTFTGSYEIYSLRTGKIVEWYPNDVKVEIYNDTKGYKEQIILSKNNVGIIENPLYSIMNEPNSTIKRLTRKLTLLDSKDEDTNSGKLDLIIQLPYVVKTDARQKQAEQRRKSIEQQLATGKYGIAYTDGTERITQLNRPVENNLLGQIEYLTNMIYNQLGMTEDVFNGKATSKTMTNYYDRTIEPIVTVIVEECRRKFLTKTARSQNQTIMAFRDILRLVPANEMGDMADSLSRNEILSANEFRAILGLKPSKSPRSDELSNKNMPQDDEVIRQVNSKRKQRIRDEQLEEMENQSK